MKRFFASILLALSPLAILIALVATLYVVVLILGAGWLAASVFAVSEGVAMGVLLMALAAAWIVLRGFWRSLIFLRSDRVAGTEATEAFAGDLLKLVEEVRSVMKAPCVRVRVGAGFAANITPLGRELTLGCALIRAFDEHYLRVVIAHELGHLMPGGSRCGWSLRRIRDTTDRLIELVSVCRDDDDWEGLVYPALWPLWLVARALRWAIDHVTPTVRACEIAADLSSLEYCKRNYGEHKGAALFADALQALDTLSWLWDLRQRPDGFNDALSWLERIRERPEALAPGDQERLTAHLERESESHPSLEARRALAGAPPAPWHTPLASRPWSPVPFRSYERDRLPLPVQKAVVQPVEQAAATAPARKPRVGIFDGALRAASVVMGFFALGALERERAF